MRMGPLDGISGPQVTASFPAEVLAVPPPSPPQSLELAVGPGSGLPAPSLQHLPVLSRDTDPSHSWTSQRTSLEQRAMLPHPLSLRPHFLGSLLGTHTMRYGLSETRKKSDCFPCIVIAPSRAWGLSCSPAPPPIDGETRLAIKLQAG